MEQIRLKHLLDYRRGYKSGPFGSALILDQLDQEGELMIYSPEHINNIDAESFFLPPERYEAMKHFFLEPNDIFFPIVGTLGKAKVFDEDMPRGMLNQRLARITPDVRKILPEYLHLCMCEFDDFQTQLALNSRGAILEHITKEALLKIALPIPSISVQRGLLRYLDRRTTKIDTLLADLQSQVEMLDRYKRELIAETVTKGLNKLTTMKDSGVEWIGEIPSHWELIKARWVFRQSNSKGNENEVLLSATQKFGMFPQDEIEGTVKVKADTDLQLFKTVHKNDFVISLRSFQGGFEISDYEGVCSPAYQVFYNATPICHRFYKWLFKSVPFIDKMNSITTGIREGRNIPYEAFAQSLIPVPPIIEQEEIAQHLDTRLTLIDGLVTDITAQIEKLKQYRQIVIHDAVTGKIKVTEG